jgi:nitroreductase
MKNLDEIILERRSVRNFNTDTPTEEQIKLILKAGMHAPYAALAVGGDNKFRQFVVINGRSNESKLVKELVKKHTQKFAKIIPVLNIFLKYKVGEAFRKRLQTDLMGNAPWYVFVIEPKGFPPAIPQSIAHCMQNMWLKATELGLGFRLISVFESMSNNEKLCDLLSVEKGRYVINCCAIGCPAIKLENSIRPEVASVTKWIK